MSLHDTLRASFRRRYDELIARDPWRFALLGLALVAAAIVGAIGTPDNDLGAFFLPAAKLAAAGHPLDLYTVRAESGIPADDGPLGLLALATLVKLTSLIGISTGSAIFRAVIGLAGGVIMLLAGGEAIRAIERLRGAALDRRSQITLIAIIAANPVVWRGLAHFGHIELALLIWLGLWATRALVEGRLITAGILLGLALLSRTTGGLIALPLGLALLWERRWHDLAKLVGVSAVVTMVGLLPFLIARPADTIFSLLGYRAQLPVGAGSIWVVVIDTPLEGFVQRWDTLLIILTALGLTAWLLWRIAPHGTAAGAITHGSALYALLGVSLLCFPLLSKMVWPYYYVEIIAPAVIWGVATTRDLRTLEAWGPALVATFLGLYGEIVLQFPPFLAIGYLLGIAQFAMLVQSIRWVAKKVR